MAARHAVPRVLLVSHHSLSTAQLRGSVTTNRSLRVAFWKQTNVVLPSNIEAPLLFFVREIDNHRASDHL